MTRTVSAAVLIPAGLAIVASTYGLARYTYGLFVPAIQDEFGLSIEIMGLIGSASYAGYLIATLFGSIVSGIAGPRLAVVLGGMTATGGMGLIALSQDSVTLALGVFLAGTSPGLAYPPLSDAVMMLIREPHRQNRTYAIINAGNSVGVIIAGPAALLATGDWRWAWAGFALFAGLATVWNGAILPAGALPGRAVRRRAAAGLAVVRHACLDLPVRRCLVVRGRHGRLLDVRVGAAGAGRNPERGAVQAVLGADRRLRAAGRRGGRPGQPLRPARVAAHGPAADRRRDRGTGGVARAVGGSLRLGRRVRRQLHPGHGPVRHLERQRVPRPPGRRVRGHVPDDLAGTALRAGAVATSASLTLAFHAAAAAGALTVLLGPRGDLFSMAPTDRTAGWVRAD